MNSEFHSNANGSNQDDHRHGTQLDSNEAHHAQKSSTVIKAKTVTFKKTQRMSGWAQTHSETCKILSNYFMSVIYKELYRYILIAGYKFNMV